MNLKEIVTKRWPQLIEHVKNGNTGPSEVFAKKLGVKPPTLYTDITLLNDFSPLASRFDNLTIIQYDRRLRSYVYAPPVLTTGTVQHLYDGIRSYSEQLLDIQLAFLTEELSHEGFEAEIKGADHHYSVVKSINTIYEHIGALLNELDGLMKLVEALKTNVHNHKTIRRALSR